MQLANVRTRAGRRPVATRRQDQLILMSHLPNRFLIVSQTAAVTPGRNNQRANSSNVRGRLRNNYHARRPYGGSGPQPCSRRKRSVGCQHCDRPTSAGTRFCSVMSPGSVSTAPKEEMWGTLRRLLRTLGEPVIRQMFWADKFGSHISDLVVNDGYINAQWYIYENLMASPSEFRKVILESGIPARQR